MNLCSLLPKAFSSGSLVWPGRVGGLGAQGARWWGAGGGGLGVGVWGLGSWGNGGIGSGGAGAAPEEAASGVVFRLRGVSFLNFKV